MNSRAFALVLGSGFVALAALLSACSGADTYDFYDGQHGTAQNATEPKPGTGAKGSSGSSGSQGIAGSSGSSGKSSSGSASSSASSSSSGSSGASSSSSSSASSSSSSSSGASGASGSSSGSGYKSPGIYCSQDSAGNDSYCDATTLICCEHGNNGGGEKTYECVSNGLAACVGGTAIRCDDRSDCPSGQVCCGTFDQSLGYKSIQCQTSCGPSPIPNTTTVRFCDPNAPTDECTTIAKTCQLSGSLDGFHVCK